MSGVQRNSRFGTWVATLMSVLAFKRVDRLVARAVLGAVALTWCVIVSLDAFRVFISELNDVGQGEYTLTKAAAFVLMTVPRRFYEMFGYAALIGGLLGLGGLANSGELTALRAAGLSKLRICASVALGLGMLTVLVALLGETLGPLGERKAQALALAAKSNEVALARGGSLWARDGASVISARSARAQGPGRIELSGVRLFEFDSEGRLASLSLASGAAHTSQGWVLQEVRRTNFGQHSATSTHTDTLSWQSSLDPSLLALSIIRPQYLSLRDLSRNIFYLESNHQDASGFRSAYWSRLFYPLNVLVLVFCAVPFAFGALRSGGLSKRLFIGIVLAIGFYFLQRSAVNLGTVYDIHPALANLLPSVVLVLAAFAYFRKHA